jgi:hypothetical protein
VQALQTFLFATSCKLFTLNLDSLQPYFDQLLRWIYIVAKRDICLHYHVQALWRLALVASARLEPMRLDQVSSYRDMEIGVFYEEILRVVDTCGFQITIGGNRYDSHNPALGAGATLCNLCSAGTYLTGIGR